MKSINTIDLCGILARIFKSQPERKSSTFGQDWFKHILARKFKWLIWRVSTKYGKIIYDILLARNFKFSGASRFCNVLTSKIDYHIFLARKFNYQAQRVSATYEKKNNFHRILARKLKCIFPCLFLIKLRNLLMDTATKRGRQLNVRPFWVSSKHYA